MKEKHERILKILSDNDIYSTNRIADKLNLNYNTTKKYLEELHKNKLIKKMISDTVTLWRIEQKDLTTNYYESGTV